MRLERANSEWRIAIREEATAPGVPFYSQFAIRYSLFADTSREHLHLQPPRAARCIDAFAEPVERIRRHLGEAPPHRQAGFVLAVLHDVPAARPADLAAVELAQRIAPQDVPGVAFRVVDAQRAPVEHVRQDPDVLDGATFQHPAGV